MGLFFYTQKGSIISMVDLPTTEIIEPFLCGLTNVNFLYRIGLLYNRKSGILGWILLHLLREFVMEKVR